MSAVIRCCCGRCRGGVYYTSAVDYLKAHQLDSHEFVLETEVEMSRSVHPSNWRSGGFNRFGAYS